MKKNILRLLVLLIAGGPVHAVEKRIEYFAKAYDRNTGKFIYTEMHSEIWVGGKHAGSEINYLGPDGKVLASKTIRYGARRAAPDFKFEDKRTGYLEAAYWSGQSSMEFWKRENPGDQVRQVRLNAPTSDTVVDAGFDYFIRENWERLMQQDVLVHFAVPARHSFFDFRIQRANRPASNPALVLFDVRIANPLLNLLVDKITVGYDRNSRRLMTYEGLSNISDENGKSRAARIVFDYSKAGL